MTWEASGREGGHLPVFLAVAPGLEQVLCDEVRAAGFHAPQAVAGGVTFSGGWPDVWRAALALRGPQRLLVRIAEFRALHLAQLDKRARKIPWADFLRADRPVRVEAVCKSSRIYHAGAAAQRIATAIGGELGAPVADEARLIVRARILDDLCTISLDVTGEPLHKRGFKEEIGKAPMRETLASLFLRQMGYDGREPLVDPMCGCGSFVIEAAEMAAGLKPGRERSFAFEDLVSFNADQWRAMRMRTPVAEVPVPSCFGRDRDAGAIRMSMANAARAGVAAFTHFTQGAVSALLPPQGTQPGLVIVNPPYGDRIGAKSQLSALYRTLGARLLVHFAGWRVGIITTDSALAKATRLPLTPAGPPVQHGGLRVTLYKTERLG